MADPKLQMESVARALIEGGESYYVEFKSAWDYGPGGKKPRDIKDVARDIAGELVAFANAEGGDLLVGVEDGGAITGLPWDGDRLHYLVQAPRQLVADVALGSRVYDVMLDGHRVLLFRVQEYPDEAVVTSDGRCLVRQGDQSVPAGPDKIRARRQDRLGELLYESQPVPQATIEDLELDDIVAAADLGAGAAAGVIERLLARGPETLLRYWNLIDQRNGHAVLRRAALLLFAREPLRWHANNRIRIRRVHGDDPGYGGGMRTRERELIGTLPDVLVEATIELTRALERESRRDTLFAVDQLLPRDAVQECLVNAVAHRNYAIEGQAIEVLLYPDRLEVRSPGQLPQPITLDDLRAQRGVHRSRNPLMMRVLRELGWTRDQGEGMRRIFGSMRQMELHEPELAVEADTFVVRLSTRSLYDDATQAWIASYGPFGLMPDERRYVVALREAGGSLSVDRLARRLGQAYDDTKAALATLEGKGLVWHGHKSRTYRLVEPLTVPHERALARLGAAGVDVAADAGAAARVVIDLDTLAQIAGTADAKTALDLAQRWKETGILAVDGKKRWKLGASFLEYLSQRDGR